MEISYRPSGSMCKVCTRFFLNCSELDFSKMQKMKTDNDGTIVVKCIEFVKVKK